MRKLNNQVNLVIESSRRLGKVSISIPYLGRDLQKALAWEDLEDRKLILARLCGRLKHLAALTMKTKIKILDLQSQLEGDITLLKQNISELLVPLLRDLSVKAQSRSQSRLLDLDGLKANKLQEKSSLCPYLPSKITLVIKTWSKVKSRSWWNYNCN